MLIWEGKMGRCCLPLSPLHSSSSGPGISVPKSRASESGAPRFGTSRAYVMTNHIRSCLLNLYSLDGCASLTIILH